MQEDSKDCKELVEAEVARSCNSQICGPSTVVMFMRLVKTNAAGAHVSK